MIYANRETAPVGTLVRSVLDHAEVPELSTVTGYHRQSIGVRHENGGSNVAPISHRGWVVVEVEVCKECKAASAARRRGGWECPLPVRVVEGDCARCGEGDLPGGFVWRQTSETEEVYRRSAAVPESAPIPVVVAPVPRDRYYARALRSSTAVRVYGLLNGEPVRVLAMSGDGAEDLATVQVLFDLAVRKTVLVGELTDVGRVLQGARFV